MKLDVRALYLYLFSFVGLIIVTIGTISLINLGIKTFIFKDADRYEVYPITEKIDGEPQQPTQELQQRQDAELARQRQRELSNAISMIVVGIPLYLYHWKTLQKETKRS